MNPSPSSAPRGLLLLSRVAAAVLGGYALAAATAVVLPALVPVARADGVLAGMQLSFAVYTLSVIWAFSPVSLPRVWAGLLLPAVVLGSLGMLWSRMGAGA